MALISKPYTFTVGALIIASEHNSNNDTLYNLVNGNIDNDNISGSAGITDDKLSQITTASKVSAAAITALANLPSGAGVIPIANIPSTMQITTATRDISLASGTTAIVLSGTSFTPRSAVILSNISSTDKMSIGLDDGSRHYCLTRGTSSWLADSSFSIRNIFVTGTTEYRGLFNSFNSGGGSITWTRVGGTTSGTMTLFIGFLR